MGAKSRRLRPLGLDVQATLEVATWFLAPTHDVRSSSFLELAATEFAIQGLEVDFGGLCWGGDLRRSSKGWEYWAFKGTKWTRVKDSTRRQYVLNKYRVLLTRARQGLVIWVPRGDEQDSTRDGRVYTGIAEYLEHCGVRRL